MTGHLRLPLGWQPAEGRVLALAPLCRAASGEANEVSGLDREEPRQVREVPSGALWEEGECLRDFGGGSHQDRELDLESHSHSLDHVHLPVLCIGSDGV